MNKPITPIKLKGDGEKSIVRGQAAGHADAHRQDLVETSPFAPVRTNNTVKCFTTGEAFFSTLSEKMKGATKSIFIAGWQVNWDVELTPGERLLDILHECVKKSPEFRVYVMPWMSPKVGVNTFDLDTMLAIFQLNAGLKNMQAMCCPAGAQSDYVGTEGAAFSHHQKMIVIDNKTAYIGGMDLAYGRYDDAKFSLNPGARRFNERYNPGVPGTHKKVAKDGNALSMMDLLTTTLTAGVWNAGGNTEPGAMSVFLRAALPKAKTLTLDAVSMVNQASRLQLELELQTMKAAASGAKRAAVESADAVAAAGNAVSGKCAALQIPDIYGQVKMLNIGSAPTSPLPGKLRKMEAGARENWNESVDDLAHLAGFLSPLSHLKVDTKPQSLVPTAMELAERGDRLVYNTFINGAAAIGSVVQYTANAERDVCVAIGPIVRSGVNQGKAAGRTIQTALGTGINKFQKAIIEQINNVRVALNDEVLKVMAKGDRAIDSFVGNLSQKDVQSLLDQLMRLAKIIYTSQLAVSWADAHAHPLLFKNETKTSVDKMLGEQQPREPWQDVHVQIEGAAVDDVAMNFINRWNACQNSYLSDHTMASMLPPGITNDDKQFYSSLIGPVVRKAMFITGDLVPQPRPGSKAEKSTGVEIRVLRSAPHKLCVQEAQARGDKILPAKEQREIQTQMINLIKNASDFIYIENQFFQTEFGEPSIKVFTPDGDAMLSGPMKYMIGLRGNRLKALLSSAGFAPGKALMPENEIGKALGDRIAEAIRLDQPFHVYLVLPVHPEGKLDDITVVGQVHWTMQSLVFADHSLVNRVRRAIAAKRLCKRPLNTAMWEKAMQDAGKEIDGKVGYTNIEEKDWAKYLTLLNLRNCQIVGGRLVTEQIYIHTKLLIVDDRHVIVGSANINDRSQSGKRDSEIAVMLLDKSTEKAMIRDVETHVNPLARNLRIAIWEKHLALTCGGNEVVKSATAIKELIKRPAADETIQAIQLLAQGNADKYAKTFSYVPWSNSDAGTGASIWPVCPVGASEKDAASLAAKMPFHDDFWKNPPEVSVPPRGIFGFFTKLPTNWTIGENNHPGQMNIRALTQTEPEVDETRVARVEQKNGEYDVG